MLSPATIKKQKFLRRLHLESKIGYNALKRQNCTSQVQKSRIQDSLIPAS